MLVALISGAVKPDCESALGALSVLRNMATRSPAARDAVRESGGIPPLVTLLVRVCVRSGHSPRSPGPSSSRAVPPLSI